MYVAFVLMCYVDSTPLTVTNDPETVGLRYYDNETIGHIGGRDRCVACIAVADTAVSVNNLR